MTEKIRVFSIDDHPLIRDGIAMVLNNQPDMQLVAQAATGREAIECFHQYNADVTLMNLRLPDMSGIEAMIAIREEFPLARFVMLSTFQWGTEIQRALSSGAHAYLLKSMTSSELVDVIRQVNAGNRKIPVQVAATLAEHLSDEPLTQREVEVLQHIAGNRNRDIAEKLFISEETVKAHMKHIIEKLGAVDRTHALVIAARRGIVHPCEN